MKFVVWVSGFWWVLFKHMASIVNHFLTGCLNVQQEGWWSYEFCYQKKLRQLHLEDDKVPSWLHSALHGYLYKLLFAPCCLQQLKVMYLLGELHSWISLSTDSDTYRIRHWHGYQDTTNVQKWYCWLQKHTHTHIYMYVCMYVFWLERALCVKAFFIFSH